MKVESVFEKWVARATRPFRPATRRPERARLSPAEGCPYSLPMRSPFRQASRRTAQASGLCYPKRNFQTRSESEQAVEAENQKTRKRENGKTGLAKADPTTVCPVFPFSRFLAFQRSYSHFAYSTCLTSYLTGHRRGCRSLPGSPTHRHGNWSARVGGLSRPIARRICRRGCRAAPASPARRHSAWAAGWRRGARSKTTG